MYAYQVNVAFIKLKCILLTVLVLQYLYNLNIKTTNTM